MISERIIRAWYTPIEVLTLRTWLVVATIVNVLLLTFDYLRGDEEILLIGFLACASIAALRASLPVANNPNQRNIALVISLVVISLGFYRLILMPNSVFNIWLNAWIIVPGIISLFWLSNALCPFGRHVNYQFRQLNTAEAQFQPAEKASEHWLAYHSSPLRGNYSDSNRVDF